MKVYQAISAVSAAMSKEGIAKTRNNQAQGYKFRGIDDVLNALSAALVDAGLVILPRCVERIVVERQTAKGGAIFNITCHVEFDLVSTEDGSKHTVSTYGEAMDSADKATNKALSAAYKYLALLMFCIPTEASADTDADFSTHEVSGQRPGAPEHTAQKDMSPAAVAARITAGVKRGEASGAALAMSGFDPVELAAVWDLLANNTHAALTAVWPKTEKATA